jgi:hypothetical protein
MLTCPKRNSGPMSRVDKERDIELVTSLNIADDLAATIRKGPA